MKYANRLTIQSNTAGCHVKGREVLLYEHDISY